MDAVTIEYLFFVISTKNRRRPVANLCGVITSGGCIDVVITINLVQVAAFCSGIYDSGLYITQCYGLVFNHVKVIIQLGYMQVINSIDYINLIIIIEE